MAWAVLSRSNHIQPASIPFKTSCVTPLWEPGLHQLCGAALPCSQASKDHLGLHLSRVYCVCRLSGPFTQPGRSLQPLIWSLPIYQGCIHPLHMLPGPKRRYLQEHTLH